MKQIALMRHAKSSWNNRELSDDERPLNQRGLRDAPVMGQRLAAMNFKPDIILSSTAVRAAVTARIIAEEIGYDTSTIVPDEDIYLAEPETLINIIRQIDNSHSSAMLFGHNPGFTTLSNEIGDAAIDNMPTCSIAVFQLEIEIWADFSRNRGKLVFFDYPKNTRIV
ncbi:MAG: histidine phosphatase family protein [Gammaproteobacteria bacterium]|nr:histidine phosphatase family protein [Gammaproteobacteria bacterium]